MSDKFKFKSRKKQCAKIFKCSQDYFSDNAQNGAHIEIFSDKELTLEGCKGILNYDTDFLRLEILKGEISVFGKDFLILSFENEVISIKGKITSLEFSN